MQNYASMTELLQAFEALSSIEKTLLRQSASAKIFRTHFTEPDDLIHEALHRCLNGTRRWPRDVNFVVFLMNVMKSISSGERSKASARQMIPLDHWQDSDPYNGEGITHLSAEEQCIELEKLVDVERRWLRLRDALIDDIEAQAVFQSQLDGLRASAIMQQLSLTAADYEIARRRLQRKIDAGRAAISGI
ncbi:hypothetical protein SAMN05192549_1115 [Duganella sacchari]|uniref:Uncharacterized protein n=1 Tax=Duganella sacchari TaxID=551987 RepID=A0A1M7R5T9_9BURK|nr:hypothetical protein [Duganella sacchari]SHN40526.1 hypothetical protein SAMN05192549_1115 [Duganella sacchari]